jgi:amino acid transporter
MEPVHVHYNDGLELHSYGGMEINQYQGVDTNQYAGNVSDEDSEKRAFRSSTNLYQEDPRSRLHRDLKTRQLSMIALGG